MKKILFIINTVLDRKKESGIEQIIKGQIDINRYEPDFVYSKYPDHSAEIAGSRLGNYDVITAVGGDGTVNEVARELIHSDKLLAIIPVGSGNGLARSLNIPLKVSKAVGLINEGRLKTIDTGTINDRPFFHMAGIGFAAEVARCYALKGNHGFAQYIIQVIRTFIKYKSYALTIRTENAEYNHPFFCIEFANVSQWGYNAHIAPGANPSDGKLDLAMLSAFPKILIPGPALRLFRKTLHRCRFMNIVPFIEAEIPRNGETWVHIDGDPVLLDGDVHVKVRPASLNVISGTV